MTEHTPNDELTARKRELSTLLTADYAPASERTARKQPSEETNALKSFLQQARSTESIDRRVDSAEAVDLSNQVMALLAPAPTSDAFKQYVANEVRLAYAWESKVPDAVAPDRLGIASGDGVFDPSQAESLEAQALRGHALDVVLTYTVGTRGDEPDELELALKPGKRSSDFAAAADRLDAWSVDYQLTYGHDALVPIEPEALFAATQPAPGSSSEQAAPTLAELIKSVNELRRHDGSD